MTPHLAAIPPLATFGRLLPLCPSTLGPQPRVELDLGCGKGGFSVQLAAERPDTLVLAADIKAGRLRRLANKAKAQRLVNVRTLHALAWELVGLQLPEASLDRLHILCPDPWPKDKHRRNRLVTSEFVARAARKIKPGGVLHLATDDLPYLEWMRTVMAQAAQFYTPDQSAIADVAHIKTEFELNFERAGKAVTHLGFVVRSRS